MKSKIVLVVCALILASVPVGSAQAKTCGIGNRIWEGNTDTNGKKLLMSTTNFWTLKAISTIFGIAGCAKGEKLALGDLDEKVLHFASGNLDPLARDMARGSGEHLDALAELMEIDSKHRPAFRSFTKRNFALLFPHDEVTVGEFLLNLDHLIAEDNKLSRLARG